MPIAVSYPGVYVEEISSGVRTITGVATSITAFVGRTRRGTTNEPVRVQSFAEFERTFGGLWSESTLSYAVAQFFQNGGGDALIVRVADSAGAASTAASVKSLKSDPAGPASAATGALPLAAASAGTWGDTLWARIEPVPGDATNKVFNLTVLDNGSGTSEQFLNLSTDPAAPRFVTRFLEQNSSLVRVSGAVPATLVPEVVTAPMRRSRPSSIPSSRPRIRRRGRRKRHHRATSSRNPASKRRRRESGRSKRPTSSTCFAFRRSRPTPISACRPATRPRPTARSGAHCSSSIRPSPGTATPRPIAGVAPASWRERSYAALFFPFVRAPDPELKGQIGAFAPCGAVAGIFARTDARARRLEGAGRPRGDDQRRRRPDRQAHRRRERPAQPARHQLPAHVPDLRQRSSGVRARSTAPTSWRRSRNTSRSGASRCSSRRACSAARSGSCSSRTTSRSGRRSGSTSAPSCTTCSGRAPSRAATPSDAYFVKCDKETTTQNDINLGIVNIVVGFAPLKPAEFVIIKIQQIAGQIAT